MIKTRVWIQIVRVLCFTDKKAAIKSSMLWKINESYLQGSCVFAPLNFRNKFWLIKMCFDQLRLRLSCLVKLKHWLFAVKVCQWRRRRNGRLYVSFQPTKLQKCYFKVGHSSECLGILGYHSVGNRELFNSTKEELNNRLNHSGNGKLHCHSKCIVTIKIV